MSNPCSRFSEAVLSDYTDRALPVVVAWRVRRHLPHCPRCTTLVAKLDALNRDAQNLYVSQPAVTLPAPRRRRVPVRPLLAGALAIAVAGVWFTPEMPGHPRVAFADVENAMRQVKTAQWISTSHHYLYGRLGRRLSESRSKQEVWVRMETPAFASRLTSYDLDRDGRQKTLVFRSFTDEQGVISQDGLGYWFYKKNTADAVPLKARIIRFLFPHQNHYLFDNKGNYPWIQSTTVLDGSKVLVFRRTLELKGKTIKHEQVAWADIKTRRLLRYQEVYTQYDSTKDHTLRLSDQQIYLAKNYRYDEPLPDAVFALKPPPGATVR